MDFTAAITLRPDYAIGLCNRGNVFLAKKEYERAIADYSQALVLDPTDAVAYRSRGSARARLDHEAAVADFGTALQFDPEDTAAYAGRGVLLAAQGSSATGLSSISARRHRGEQPDNAIAYACRGLAYYGKREYARALQQFTAAARLDPNSDSTCCSMAWILATCPEAGLRDGRRALEYARRACELTQYQGEAITWGPMAAAHAEVGQFAEAVRWQKRALEFPDYERRHGGEARQRLQLYEQQQPYREEPADAGVTARH